MTITYTDALTEVQDMRQIELPRWGEANLSITTAARPKPGPGQVLVQMKAISLNFRDLLVINGLYNPKMPLPLVPVSDGAGVIVDRSPGAEKFKPRTRRSPRPPGRHRGVDVAVRRGHRMERPLRWARTGQTR